MRQARSNTTRRPTNKRAVGEILIAKELNEVLVNAVERALGHHIDGVHIHAHIDVRAICDELRRAGNLLAAHDAENAHGAVISVGHQQQVGFLCAGCLTQGNPLRPLEQVARQQRDALGDVGQLRIVKHKLIE